MDSCACVGLKWAGLPSPVHRLVGALGRGWLRPRCAASLADQWSGAGGRAVSSSRSRCRWRACWPALKRPSGLVLACARRRARPKGAWAGHCAHHVG